MLVSMKLDEEFGVSIKEAHLKDEGSKRLSFEYGNNSQSVTLNKAQAELVAKALIQGFDLDIGALK
ncbi:hypothetical protein HNP46_000267 [Pseudomonas nitritireducens]|uniref:Uncharacterized protein n=1 Tax=Pseudomonas nitroreducens TaxID=46680 RepID=A0A7W7NYH0_PSENT|nr:hypothetical protein [Pseudomonas nitritireducens]MBB4861456.1 hypothetical protein [Pseudomonas nitritireducens]